MRVLNVAEKNDAAKNIASLLSRGNSNRREGLSKFNKIYEFTCDVPIFGPNCQMLMTSVSGHLLAKEFPGQYSRWDAHTTSDLFDAPVLTICPKNYENIQRTLHREIRSCQKLIIWTDCDREGENIGFEIIRECMKAKPNLNYERDVWRARFSEITFQAAHNAIHNLRRPDENASNAVDCRSELDLRIGAAFTRLMTLKYRDQFGNFLGEKRLMSYGSCQFPTLGFVVERYKEIQRYIREDFWKLKVTHTFKDPEKIRVEFRWQRIRLFEKLPCEILLDVCQENPLATVVNFTQKPKSKWRPQPMDTIEMEKLASRILKINAKETMKIAEKLYQQGFVSYPRTETNIFPNGLDLRPLIQNQTGNGQWGQFAQAVLEKGPNPRRGKKSDQAHPPIHPIKPAENLTGNEKRIYELITRHFLATCSEDAKGLESTITINIADEIFLADGLIILERNYLEVYPYDRWEGKILPRVQIGHKFTPDKIEMASGQTSPPSLLSEADLIALMEKYGIGTDATHAEHIDTIQQRQYVGMDHERRFIPGRIGMGLVDGYDEINYGMSKPHLRSSLEDALKGICEGTRRKEDVLAEQVNSYRTIFLEAEGQIHKLTAALTRYTQM